VGKSPGLDHNEFLATEANYGDFILKLTFRVNGDDTSNSGVQFRSIRIPKREMLGYQADIGQRYWACLYDESRRRKVIAQADSKALEALNKTGWNTYVLRAQGNRIQLLVNGVQSFDYREPDPDIARDGKIALQLHSGHPLEMRFESILIQPLPVPKADSASTPGFHLRTVQAPDGPRKYTVYLPEGFDGRKLYPVVLFLHGSGSRGDDGILPAQSGLGPIIAGHPSGFPIIAVFPQARRSWLAGTDDAKGALAALDDVMATYSVDRDRVILTGLSMGGRGSWELASSAPERFSAIVPICGSFPMEGVAKLASKIKALPTWTFVGDADADRTVLSMRAIATALRAAGAAPRSTEYRDVGHNSWDRAYSEPGLITWMLQQKRQGRE
jgi:poly(3-hydroxybutyrate) depolymerase